MRFIWIKATAAVFAAVLVICGFCGTRVNAMDDTGIYLERLDELDLTEISGLINSVGTLPQGMSFRETAVKAITGELDLSLSQICKSLLIALFSEVSSFSRLLRDMALIAMLGAILNALSSGLRTKSVSEMGYFITYVVIAALLMDSFILCLDVMRGFVGVLRQIVEAAAPLMAGLLLMSGNPSAAAVFNPLAIFAAGAAELAIANIAAPALSFAATLEIINNITEKPMLTRFAALIKKAVSTGLKAMAALFAAVLTLQRLSVPILDGAIAKTAKFAVSSVPVVGGALTGAVDAVAYWSSAVKNGVLAAVILAIALMCLPTLLKMAAFVIAYKLTAALLQPVCDKRVVNAIDAAGSLAGVAFGACGLAAVVFMFMMMIMISI